MFETAWADYTASQWELCIGGFEQYLRTFPKSEMSGEAQYYIGECNFAAGKFGEALSAYERVVATYPRSTRVPEAIYKRGVSLERLGQADRARESYEQVMRNYPDSDAARLAKQALSRVGRGRGPE
jgi:tol-pal system protein YbgF